MDHANAEIMCCLLKSVVNACEVVAQRNAAPLLTTGLERGCCQQSSSIIRRTIGLY